MLALFQNILHFSRVLSYAENGIMPHVRKREKQHHFPSLFHICGHQIFRERNSACFLCAFSLDPSLSGLASFYDSRLPLMFLGLVGWNGIWLALELVGMAGQTLMAVCVCSAGLCTSFHCLSLFTRTALLKAGVFFWHNF